MAAPVVVEAGPASLSGLARRHPDVGADGHPVITLLPERPGRHILDALGALWINGADVDFARLPHGQRSKYPLPTYPYRRTEFLLPDRSRTVTSSADPGRIVPGSAVAGAPQPRPPEAPADMTETDGQWVVALPTWQPAGTLTPRRPPSPGTRGHAIVLLPRDAALASWARRVVQRAGYRVLPITYGDRIDVQDYGCAIRMDHPEDLRAALEALARSDQVELIVHAAGCGPVAGERVAPDTPQVLEPTVLSALRLQQYASGLREQRGHPLRMVVLSSGAAQVTAAEPLEPARAAAAAVARYAVAAHGPGTARMLDVAGVQDDALAAEIAAPAFTHPVLALRGAQVWRPKQVRCSLPEWSPTLLQPEGRYVIVDGLGAIGLAVARELADSGLQPKLVLLSRGTTERLDADTRRRLAALEAAGGEVTLMTGDVADREQTAALFERIATEHGPVHGVVHAAGGPSAWQHERADAHAVPHHRVHGAVALRDLALSTSSIRFLALLTNTAALEGRASDAPYAAGEAFVDALAAAPVPDGRTTVLSLDWSAWRGADATVPGSAGAMLDERGAATLLRLLCEHAERHMAVVPAEAWTDVHTPKPTMTGTRPVPSAAPPQRPRTGQPPTDLLESIRALWAETLGLPTIADDADFFSLGADSLTTIQMVTRLRDRFGLELSATEIYEAPTVLELAAVIARRLS